MVRYLYPGDYYPARIRKVDKDFTKEHDFKDIGFAPKIRDICRIEKRIVSALVSFVMKTRKNIQSSIQYTDKRQADLLLIREETKKHYVLIKYFSAFKYDHTLYHGWKQFYYYYYYYYYLQSFSTAENLKSYVNDCC